MAVQNSGVLVSGTAAGNAVATTLPQTLPANCLCLAAVFTYNATAGNLAKSPPVQAGAQWIELDSIAVGANRLLTLYCTMVTDDITATITFTAAGALSQVVTYAVSWRGGVYCGGTANGLGCVVQVVKAGSAGNVTTLSPPPTFAPWSHFNNGAYACFVSVNTGGIAPRAGWTEGADLINVSTLGRLETQSKFSEDTVANCVAGNGLLAGIALEIKATPNPVTANLVDQFVFGNLPSPFARSYNLYSGRTLLIMADAHRGDATILGRSILLNGSPPLIAVDRGAGTASHRTYFWVLPWDGPDGSYGFSFDVPSGDTALSNIYFDVTVASVGNADPVTGGVVQWALASGGPIVWDNPIDRNHTCVMLWAQNNNLTTTAENGWQRLVDAVSGVNRAVAAWRANGDPEPNYNQSSATFVGIAFEFTPAAPIIAVPPEPPPAVAAFVPGGEGEDIWFDVSSPGGADRIVTPSGDWKMVSGEEALRQSLLRRLLTSPGDWATLPDYGVGAPDYVYAKNTRAARDELTARIHAQFIRDYRVERVSAVRLDWDDSQQLRIEVQVLTKLSPATNRPFGLSVSIG